ncbi:MAG: DUF2586 family protein [Bacteroidales bacterium]|jgi:hypothetical protein|nr:DUF2586 family protein [Bacteroidales bacterium]
MSFQGVKINKINGGLGGGETADRVAVIVLGCGAIGNTLEMNRAYELLQLSDVEALGITEARDASANRLDWYQLSEVFRLSPDTRICLVAVPTTTKPGDLKTLPAFVSALRSIEGVNTIAIAGILPHDPENFSTGIAALQILADDLAADHIYIDAILLEGDGSYLKPGIANNTSLRGLDSPNVSVIIGHDPAIAARKAAYANHAAVGSALGMLMVRAVHENLGSVDIEVKPGSRKGEQDYSLTDVKSGRWLSAALSNGKNFNTLSNADQAKLNELGYIYVGSFAGYGGYFFSNSHTCEASDSDYCFIERNAIWNKAAGIIRRTLIPRIRSKVEANPATGYIKETTITDWDGRVRKALEPMKAEKNIADFDIYIDPNQAAVSNKPFRIQVKLVADGVVHEFDVDLGFTNKI